MCGYFTGRFFPDDIGRGHALSLTVECHVSVPLDARVAGLDDPSRRH